MDISLKSNLDHSRAAYLFAIACLQKVDQSTFPSIYNGFRFDRPSQIQSMVIELGWAFFCRYEACLETYLKRRNVTLSKNTSLKCWLSNKGLEIPADLETGLDCYRRIRNNLHHEDGASFNGEDDGEIQLLPDHMEQFYKLFVWVEESVESSFTQSSRV